MSRHRDDEVSVLTLAKYTGFSGSEMSMKAVPLVRPKITYSFPSSGSVQPQMSFISPLPTWFTPMAESRSTSLHG